MSSVGVSRWRRWNSRRATIGTAADKSQNEYRNGKKNCGDNYSSHCASFQVIECVAAVLRAKGEVFFALTRRLGPASQLLFTARFLARVPCRNTET